MSQQLSVSELTVYTVCYAQHLAASHRNHNIIQSYIILSFHFNYTALKRVLIIMLFVFCHTRSLLICALKEFFLSPSIYFKLSMGFSFYVFYSCNTSISMNSENNILLFVFLTVLNLHFVYLSAQPHSTSRHPHTHKTQTHTFPCVYIASFLLLCRLYQHSGTCYNSKYDI